MLLSYCVIDGHWILGQGQCEEKNKGRTKQNNDEGTDPVSGDGN